MFAPGHSPPVNEWRSDVRRASSALTDGLRRWEVPELAFLNGVVATTTRHHHPVALAAGDVFQHPAEIEVFRAPARAPRVRLERCPDADREATLVGLTEQLAEQGFRANPNALLGATRPLRLGVLRGVWAHDFLVEATLSDWAPAGQPLSWVVWQLMAAGPALGLEVLRGTPRDERDAAAVVEWVRTFAPPRLRRVELRCDFDWNPERFRGIDCVVERPPRLSVVPADAPYVQGLPRAVWAEWRQIEALALNGRRAEDNCAWPVPLRAQLREGDELALPSTSPDGVPVRRWMVGLEAAAASRLSPF